jgi:hypothetical protein
MKADGDRPGVSQFHSEGCTPSWVCDFFYPLGGNLTMEQHEQERFDLLYAQHLQALEKDHRRP